MPETQHDRGEHPYELDGADLYPHLKITDEEFPRILATRKIYADGAEYFGAYLPRTAVRILIDFLNRTFRLRSCDIQIDGSFNVPCTQYYRKRCVAPCVSDLCSGESYRELTEPVRRFLKNDRAGFLEIVKEQIDKAAVELDFERAGRWRDVLNNAEFYWKQPRWQVWLDDAVDTFEVDRTAGRLMVFLITQRGRHVLGRKAFAFDSAGEGTANVLQDLISQFYKFHLPREIRVTEEFPGRRLLAAELAERFRRPLKILVLKDARRRVTTERALKAERSAVSLREAASVTTPAQIGDDLKAVFGLARRPRRIEAYDVAHISGTRQTVAMSVWRDGRFLSQEYQVALSTLDSELSALAAFMESRFRRSNIELPDLILIDGGRAHVNAAAGVFGGTNHPSIIGAVKPPRKHSQISHFITTDGATVKFSPSSPAMSVLQVLRDEAHDLANHVHRESRDMAHFYSAAAMLPSLTETERQDLLKITGSLRALVEIDEDDLRERFGEARIAVILQDIENYESAGRPAGRPLIVPIRFDDPNGDASDLRPIEAFKP